MKRDEEIDATLLRMLRGPFEELSREQLAFGRALLAESHRGAVLIAGAHADNVLRFLLQTAALDASSATELLDHANAPLGAFSARIVAAHAFGLISDRLRRNLDQLREARNYCAHHVLGVDFDDQKLRAHLLNIELTPLDPRLKEEFDAGAVPGFDVAFERLAEFMGELAGWARSILPVLERGDHRAELTRRKLH